MGKTVNCNCTYQIQIMILDKDVGQCTANLLGHEADLANRLTMWFNYQINDRKHGANIDHVFILLAGQIPQKGSEIWHTN